MSTRRFEVTLVPETTRHNSSSQPSETIPLIHIENEIPPPPPLPTSLSSANAINNTMVTTTNNRFSSRLFSAVRKRKSLDTRRRATLAAAIASSGNQIKKSISAELIHEIGSTSRPPNSSSLTNFSFKIEKDESDVYATTQSNNDTNPSSITNKFLQELRLKRRELLDKSKNISIDLRVDLNRRLNHRPILRAQDIFNVHFQLNDDHEHDNLFLSEANFFTEESQEKIRDDIYKELNRQQTKQYRKRNRHLIFGRSLLILMTLLFAFMSFTLICVVSDLYKRANSSEAILPETEFISMMYDKATNLY